MLSFAANPHPHPLAQPPSTISSFHVNSGPPSIPAPAAAAPILAPRPLLPIPPPPVAVPSPPPSPPPAPASPPPYPYPQVYPENPDPVSFTSSLKVRAVILTICHRLLFLWVRFFFLAYCHHHLSI